MTMQALQLDVLPVKHIRNLSDSAVSPGYLKRESFLPVFWVLDLVFVYDKRDSGRLPGAFQAAELNQYYYGNQRMIFQPLFSSWS